MNPKILTKNSRVDGCKFVELFKFRNGHEVPIYEIFTTSALNQLIGHVKFSNSAYGNVFYRGISALYDNVLPAHLRDKVSGTPKGLIKILKAINGNDFFAQSLKLRPLMKCKSKDDYAINQRIERMNCHCIEGLLQHYSGSTRFLDIVDNHWVALWMGLHKFNSYGKNNLFCNPQKRIISVEEIIDGFKGGIQLKTLEPCVYVLLMAFPYPTYGSEYGISEGNDFVVIDLRRALPSIYLRPHAQHALVVRRRDTDKVQPAGYYDLASQVVSILKIRTDRVDKWLGNGDLLTKENLFPSPGIDQGYNTLLMHSEIFKYPFQIIKYF